MMCSIAISVLGKFTLVVGDLLVLQKHHERWVQPPTTDCQASVPNLELVWVVPVLLYCSLEIVRIRLAETVYQPGRAGVNGRETSTLRKSIAVLRSVAPPVHSKNCCTASSEGCAAMATEAMRVSTESDIAELKLKDRMR